MPFKKDYYTKRIDETISDNDSRLGVVQAIMRGDEEEKPSIFSNYRAICKDLNVNIFTAHYLIKQVKYRAKLNQIEGKEAMKEDKRKEQEKQKQRNMMQERVDERWNMLMKDQAMRQKCLESAHKAYVQCTKKELKMAEKAAKKQQEAIQKTFKVA